MNDIIRMGIDLGVAQLALAKINVVRNSIIGAQAMNWSEHVYPLVAALDEAGVHGLGYPEARANMGTLLEREAKALADARAAREHVRVLRGDLTLLAYALEVGEKGDRLDLMRELRHMVAKSIELLPDLADRE